MTAVIVGLLVAFGCGIAVGILLRTRAEQRARRHVLGSEVPEPDTIEHRNARQLTDYTRRAREIFRHQ